MFHLPPSVTAPIASYSYLITEFNLLLLKYKPPEGRGSFLYTTVLSTASSVPGRVSALKNVE
mgnify:CR=1 FL=1